jgi:YVTN family beta-propeller protein
MTPEARTFSFGRFSRPLARSISPSLFLSAAVIVPALAFAPAAIAQTITPGTPTVVGGAPINTTTFGISLSPDGKTAWVANYADTTSAGQVTLIDVATQTVGASIPVGEGPAEIAFSPYQAFVTNLYDSTLTEISLRTLTPKLTVNLGGVPLQFPFGVSYDRGALLVTTQGDEGFVPQLTTPDLSTKFTFSIPGQTGIPTATLDNAGHYPKRFLVPVFVTTNGGASGYPQLDVVDPDHFKIEATVALPSSGASPTQVVVSPGGEFAFVSLFDSSGGNGGVWIVNLKTLTTVKVVETGDTANYGEALSADGNYLLVAGFLQDQLALIDTKTKLVDNIIPTGDFPNGIAITADGSEAFFTNQGDGTVSVVTFSPSL